MKGSPYSNIFYAFPAFSFTTFDMVQSLISSGRNELERITEGNREKLILACCGFLDTEMCS
ncbi:hypothetical protein C4D60_Mb11t21600 [Musa balbisiana]|uniref:Uncharacterized protein n=1 Tax=Musa balbisiana TaxID=52838 RepID=A0A4S8J622_MUSBA|nr:hypothetical protein C4D60_Mb11t21600 [Musa balbisiana]